MQGEPPFAGGRLEGGPCTGATCAFTLTLSYGLLSSHVLSQTHLKGALLKLSQRPYCIWLINAKQGQYQVEAPTSRPPPEGQVFVFTSCSHTSCGRTIALAVRHESLRVPIKQLLCSRGHSDACCACLEGSMTTKGRAWQHFSGGCRFCGVAYCLGMLLS